LNGIVQGGKRREPQARKKKLGKRDKGKTNRWCEGILMDEEGIKWNLEKLP